VSLVPVDSPYHLLDRQPCNPIDQITAAFLGLRSTLSNGDEPNGTGCIRVWQDQSKSLKLTLPINLEWASTLFSSDPGLCPGEPGIGPRTAPVISGGADCCAGVDAGCAGATRMELTSHGHGGRAGRETVFGDKTDLHLECPGMTSTLTDQCPVRWNAWMMEKNTMARREPWCDNRCRSGTEGLGRNARQVKRARVVSERIAFGRGGTRYSPTASAAPGLRLHGCPVGVLQHSAHREHPVFPPDVQCRRRSPLLRAVQPRRVNVTEAHRAVTPFSRGCPRPRVRRHCARKLDGRHHAPPKRSRNDWQDQGGARDSVSFGCSATESSQSV
jgi:hypothetical protein